jgi:hypothetical protein
MMTVKGRDRDTILLLKSKTGTTLFNFIYGVFYDTVSIPDYMPIALNDSMINK